MKDLPRGAVTFLFSEIDGSTRLVHEMRGGWDEVLAEHQRLLREAIQRHGGHEVGTEGAAVLVAFPSARGAVLAALEAQRALTRHPWPEGAAVEVRMGIHTGQAVPISGHYGGSALDRVARICAAGHGEQVLVSQTTQTLLEDEEEEDSEVALRDLGQHRLTDGRPMRLYQLAAPGLRVEFPPLRREEEPSEIAAAPVYRRWRVVLPAAAAGLVAVTAVAALLMRSAGGGLGEVAPNNVGLIDPQSNHVLAAVPVGLRPGPVAVQPGGPVWVGNVDDRAVTKIDPEQRAEAGTFRVKGAPTGIAVGLGAVWVVQGRLGTLSRIDPRSGSVAQTIELGGPSKTGAVAVGERAVWVVFGDSMLSRVNPATMTESGRGHTGASPSAIVVALGSIWVTNSDESNVYRFNPATFETAKVDAVPVGQDPAAIAFGAHSLWIANRGQDTVTEIDVASNAITTIPVGDRPSAVTFGAGGVWVANSGDGTVSRIDPVTATVAKTIHVGNAPAGIAVGDGYVWVTVQQP